MGCDSTNSCRDFVGDATYRSFFITSTALYGASVAFVALFVRQRHASHVPILFILASLTSRAIFLGTMINDSTRVNETSDWGGTQLFQTILSRFSWLCMFTALTFVARTWHTAINAPSRSQIRAAVGSWNLFYSLNGFVWVSVLVSTLVLYLHTDKRTAQLNYVVVAYSFFMLALILLAFSVVLANRVPNPGKIVGFAIDVVFFTFLKVIILAYSNFYCGKIPGSIDCIVYPFLLYDISDILPALHLVWILKPKKGSQGRLALNKNNDRRSGLAAFKDRLSIKYMKFGFGQTRPSHAWSDDVTDALMNQSDLCSSDTTNDSPRGSSQSFIHPISDSPMETVYRADEPIIEQHLEEGYKSQEGYKSLPGNE